MSGKRIEDGAVVDMDSQASEINSRCQPKHFREFFDDLKIIGVSGMGELIR